jgi:septum site-determining protein MinD
MGEAIVVTSGKGGVGKTTVSANLGVALALSGRSVVVVDADIGLRNLDVVLGLENRIVYDLVHVIEGHCRLRQALVKDKRVEGLFLLPAAQTRDKTAVTPEQMKVLVEELKSKFDFVLVDCPAGIEQGFRNSIAGADRGLVVTTPEMSAIRDADRIIGLLEAYEVPDPRLIINRYRAKMVARGDMINKEDIEDILSIPLIGLLPDSEEIVTTTNRGVPVAFNHKSQLGKSFHNIAKRLQGIDVPITNLEDESGFFTRMKQWMGMGGNT